MVLVKAARSQKRKGLAAFLFWDLAARSVIIEPFITGWSLIDVQGDLRYVSSTLSKS